MFFAYPDNSELISHPIESAIAKINDSTLNQPVKGWKETSVIGSFIRNSVHRGIDNEREFVADITYRSFNVTYELGYAIGRGKHIALVKNRAVEDTTPGIIDVGIFDTIGFKEYSNSNELSTILKNIMGNGSKILEGTYVKTEAPVYLLMPKYKTDFVVRITSRLKTAGINFRAFDPNEQPRLSPYDAVIQVAQSHGVVIPLLAPEAKGSEVHNLRAAFLYGLASGMNKITSLLQHSDSPVPINYRDFVNVYYHPDDINKYIADFAPKVTSALQTGRRKWNIHENSPLIQRVILGESAAENEVGNLANYYIKTEEFKRTLRGEVELVVGRKGSGKSAIFFQILAEESGRYNSLVLDLKPEGYKMLRFKDRVSSFLSEGTFEHTITAFWEYLLMQEICYKILNSDKDHHRNHHYLVAPYQEIYQRYGKDEYNQELDFSDRMSNLMENLMTRLSSRFGNTEKKIPTSPEITELVYTKDIKDLRTSIANYLKNKKRTWILFDNIDKAWYTDGVSPNDIIMLKTLIEAVRSLQRSFHKEEIEVFPVVFLRNDVYDLLVRQTSDRQKELKVIIDWNDINLLKEVIKKRISYSIREIDSSASFDELWPDICVSHYKGEETFKLLCTRSLMRPRFLINLIRHCRSKAINSRHEKIEESDIETALDDFSREIREDIKLEIQDIKKDAEKILYKFTRESPSLTQSDLLEILADFVSDENDFEKLLDMLLYYGFLGVKINHDEVKYIYDEKHDLQLLKALATSRSNQSKQSYLIHPTFWPALGIGS